MAVRRHAGIVPNGGGNELEELNRKMVLQSPRMDVPRALRIDVPPFGALEALALEILPVHPPGRVGPPEQNAVRAIRGQTRGRCHVGKN